jgi:hypothetical protein
MAKQFQSGHEVLSHYVPGYASSRAVGAEYNHDRLLSGHRLGAGLLEELRTAVSKIIRDTNSRSPAHANSHPATVE